MVFKQFRISTQIFGALFRYFIGLASTILVFRSKSTTLSIDSYSQGMQTHQTISLGVRRKFSTHDVLREISQCVYFFVYCALLSHFS